MTEQGTGAKQNTVVTDLLEPGDNIFTKTTGMNHFNSM